MYQLYPIYEADVQEAYRKLNMFLAELAALDIDVPLENIRTNTKFYPDYGQTATTIEVAVHMNDLAAYEIAPKIMDAHHWVINGKTEVPAPEAEEKPVAETSPVTGTSNDFDPFLDADDMP